MAALLGAGGTAEADIYDANQDLKAFELSTNSPVPGQNGVWSYGTADAAGLFTPFSATEHNDSIVLPGIPANSLEGWQEDTNSDLVPAVAVNTTGGDVTSSCCGVYQADEIWMHPNPAGSPREFAVIAWTAPAPGTLNSAAGQFINEGGGNAQVYLLVNGGIVATGTATGSDPSGATTLSTAGFGMLAGETIAFVVGPNSAGGHGGTSTGFFGTIDFTPVPEPASAGLLLLGGLTLLRRRHK